MLQILTFRTTSNKETKKKIKNQKSTNFLKTIYWCIDIKSVKQTIRGVLRGNFPEKFQKMVVL